ncbi:MAG: hypothetical protein H0U76_11435 [Ktedonobacteraceae bacterium]|nr:hypothetical protein [Ktedonobacteraceae bacterium]
MIMIYLSPLVIIGLVIAIALFAGARRERARLASMSPEQQWQDQQIAATYQMGSMQRIYEAGKLRVLLCSEGVVTLKKGQAEAIRWDQVEALWKDVSLSHGSDSSDTYQYTLVRNDGVKLEYSNKITDIELLGRKIEQEVTRHLLPAALAAATAGHNVVFGDITVSTHTISAEAGRKTLPFSELEHIAMDEEVLDIYRKGEKRAWHHQQVSQIPNPAILQEIVDHLQQEEVRRELPQVIAAYTTGTPIVFGDLSLSLQGVEIDQGKERVPWSEIKSIDVKEQEVSIRLWSKLLYWKTLPRWMTPNAAMLKELAAHIMQVRLRATQAHIDDQLPQVIASYTAGIPINFGRITLSTQGVSIDQGKKFLPWHEVKRIRIEAFIGGEQVVVGKKGWIISWQVLPMADISNIDLLKAFVARMQSGIIV